ncbi:MAG TPA: NAD(P)H-dependent oxidoreductase [Spirochaetales bacterium]|nr:NAD(P)H-dependent oxidoreductase [Spirochaetales bacterium]
MEGKLRVLIVNGSPKGEHSLTLQHSLYMLGQEPAVEWTVLQAGEALSPIDYDESWLRAAIDEIERADAILWSTPVYTMLVPWQLLRLFQLVKEAGRNAVFKGKYATSMMTCFHYYDHLAEAWLRATCEDLGMAYMEGRTADNMDMLRNDHRASMRFFMREFVEACRSRSPLERKYAPLSDRPSPRFELAATGAIAKDGQKAAPRTVLLTDEYRKDGNLSRMIDAFVDAYPYPVEVVDINDFPYEAGCHGCLRCELVGECDRKDGFQEFYLNLVDTCDALVFGMNLEGRYLRPVWKLFLDRTFSNGHRTSMMGKHTAYLVAGPLRSLPNVRQFLEGKDNVGRENCMAIIGDEYDDSALLGRLLRDGAVRLARAIDGRYQKSVNFLGWGGLKIFRDLIYGMRGVVRDDHRFYKTHGLYDFPQKDIPKQLFNLAMGLAFTLKPVRVQAFERMPSMYILLHKRIVDSGKP